MKVPTPSVPSFAEQVQAWLWSAGYVSYLRVLRPSVFPTLVVQRPRAGGTLALRLIDLPTWRAEPEDLLKAPDEGTWVQLWEDTWLTQRDIVQSRLLARLGQSTRIPARLCEIRRISQPTLDAFLKTHHLQGTASARIKYGLFLKPRYLGRAFAKALPSAEEPVAVAGFSNARTIWRGGRAFRSCELIRFASLKYHTVVGGLNKCIQTFVNEWQPDDLMTYADRDWSSGHSYRHLGFLVDSATPPQLFWLDLLTLRRHDPQRLVGTKLVPSTPPPGFLPVYNRGNLKFVRYFVPPPVRSDQVL
ncbi:hypothetical protein GCM10027275_12150 [Rhabdobacter roseus]|uniref:Uncharacterized protein n=1 Tax=Rhabdobacter roseus TaxID=1655419 RepID=A0A840TT01_9BACT|nr:hypothetical protein [Rhabdobacter roseus]MBB5283130.1 hypothetical protein [Rhabdobacter roseus]